MGVRRDPSLEHVGRLDGRPQFLGAVLLGAGRVTHGDDATGRADLDEIGAVLDLVADGAPNLVGTVCNSFRDTGLVTEEARAPTSRIEV